MSIVNYTPHTVSVYEGATYNPAIRKYEGGTLTRCIPSCGVVLNARMDTTPVGDVEGVPCVRAHVVDVDPAPAFGPGDYFIVSTIYVNACKALGFDTSHMLTVDGAVVDSEGHVVGCVGFRRN